MIIDGRKVADLRLERVRAEIEKRGSHPRLATVLVGEDPGSRMYVKMKHEACARVGIGSVQVSLPEETPTGGIISRINELNHDQEIDGILVQLPLPSHVDTKAIILATDPSKDVDGFHPLNFGSLFAGTPKFVPCTPKGIMTLLDEYQIPIEGVHAVVAGRSIDVGRPVAALLLQRDATVTIAHSKTRNLAELLRSADILVSAVGKPKFITAAMIKQGAAVIDVGINYLDGKLCGDVDFDGVKEIAGAITPVPGGVGPMTIASLMENTLKARLERSCTDVQ